MSLSQDDVQKIALLARIGVSEKEIANYQKDLSAILEYFKKLDEVDTDDIEPIGHITGMTNVYRADDVSDFDQEGKDIMKKNLPEEKDGQIKVKSVM